MESELNEGKMTVEKVKLLDKKISRMQKESDFGHILNDFRMLE
jgi:hypothetical protein